MPRAAPHCYNPNLAFWVTGPAGEELATESLGLTTVFNGTLEAVYGALGVPVADVETAFRTFHTGGGVVPVNVRAVCGYTLMCEKVGGQFVFVLSDYDRDEPGPQTDIHPSNKGYRRIAKTHTHLIDELHLIHD